MAGNDHVVINARERPLSSDINDLQDLGARALAEVLKHGWTFPSQYGPGQAVPALQTRPGIVLGGLLLAPSGSDVSISAGALLQNDFGSISPAPGALDSSMRIAYQRSAVTVTAPSPVGDTYYLLEAQMQEVVATTESRDILNNITGNFVPTTVNKRVERTINYRFKAGTSTNFPAPSGATWIAIAGVFRPAGGGAVLAAHLYDMRPLPDGTVTGGRQRTAGQVSRRDYWCDDVQPYMREIQVEARSQWGEMWLRAGDAESHVFWLKQLTAEIADPSNPPSAAASGTWYYMYLAPFGSTSNGKYLPTGQKIKYLDVNGELGPALTDVVRQTGDVRGVLVESTIAPDSQGGYTNGSPLHLPAPFNVSAIPAGEAMLVGAFCRDGASDRLLAFATGNVVSIARTASVDGQLFQAAISATGSTAINIEASGKVPVSASHASLSVNAFNTVSTPALMTFQPKLYNKVLWTDTTRDTVGQSMSWTIRSPAKQGVVAPFTWVSTIPGGGTTYVLTIDTFGFEEAIV